MIGLELDDKGFPLESLADGKAEETVEPVPLEWGGQIQDRFQVLVFDRGVEAEAELVREQLSGLLEVAALVHNFVTDFGIAIHGFGLNSGLVFGP